MADADREANDRATSPYHKRCFPPYCDNASHVDKHAIGKMPREDLEDRYIVYGDENLAMKKQLRENERQIQRLQTALARQDKLDKKGGNSTPASAQYDNSRIEALESQNKSLQAKVKVLKQQLINHSFYHSKADSRDKQRKREQNASPESSYRDISRAQSAREEKTRSYKSDSPRRSFIDGKDTAALKERIAVLEQLLDTQSEKYKEKIAELEKNTPSEKPTSSNDALSVHSQKLNDNMEMIKMRRQIEDQVEQVANLTEQNEAALKEIAELENSLKQATERADELQKQLDGERERLRDSQSHLSKSISHAETIKVLEEQIRDLEKEKATLKDTNEQLLQLTTGPQSKSSDRISVDSKIRAQVLSLERSLKEKMQDIEEKDEQIKQLEALVEELKQPKEVQDIEEKNEQIKQLEALVEELKQPKEGSILCPSCKDTVSKEKVTTKSEDKLTVSFADSKKNIPSINEELRKECECLESRLKDANDELQELRPIAEQHKQCSDLKRENSDLRKRLDDAGDVIERLREDMQPIDFTSSKIQQAFSNKSSRERPVSQKSSPVKSPSLKSPVSSKVAEPSIKSAVASKATTVPSTKSAVSSKAPESESKTHTVLTEDQQPLQKPLMVIVSNNEFDVLLHDKQDLPSKTELMMPDDDKQVMKCRLEICVYDLEVDSQMLNQIEKLNKSGQVYIVWSYLGLEQKTEPMPVAKAQFLTNVTYFGPISKEMTRHIKQNRMPMSLMLVGDRMDHKVAEGWLDLRPALEQPARGILRSVTLRNDRPGSALVYVSYKLFDCCVCEDPSAGRPTDLQVGIGRLNFTKPESVRPGATHFYVDYSLLGQCGPEVETDSVPKAEVMPFNYKKQMSVDDKNASSLDPLLNARQPKPLRFNVLCEPCNLDKATEVQEVGFAEVNLLYDLVYKNQDVVSAPLPVYNNAGERLGTLSVTILGKSTLQGYSDTKADSLKSR